MQERVCRTPMVPRHSGSWIRKNSDGFPLTGWNSCESSYKRVPSSLPTAPPLGQRVRERLQNSPQSRHCRLLRGMTGCLRGYSKVRYCWVAGESQSDNLKIWAIFANGRPTDPPHYRWEEGEMRVQMPAKKRNFFGYRWNYLADSERMVKGKVDTSRPISEDRGSFL